MKLVKQASGKTTIKMSRKEWEDMGKKAGWMKEAQADNKNRGPLPDVRPMHDRSLEGYKTIAEMFRNVFQKNDPSKLNELQEMMLSKTKGVHDKEIKQEIIRAWDPFNDEILDFDSSKDSLKDLYPKWKIFEKEMQRILQKGISKGPYRGYGPSFYQPEGNPKPGQSVIGSKGDEYIIDYIKDGEIGLTKKSNGQKVSVVYAQWNQFIRSDKIQLVQ